MLYASLQILQLHDVLDRLFTAVLAIGLVIVGAVLLGLA
jgi:hypothetical protein